jgi:hypothetical protein
MPDLIPIPTEACDSTANTVPKQISLIRRLPSAARVEGCPIQQHFPWAYRQHLGFELLQVAIPLVK